VIDYRDGAWTARFHDDTVLSGDSADDLRTVI
jgi:hypothetical protein